MNKSFIMNALIIVLLIIVGLILLKFLTQLVILVVIIGGAYLLYRLYLKNKRKRLNYTLKISFFLKSHKFRFFMRGILSFYLTNVNIFSYWLVKIITTCINFHR